MIRAGAELPTASFSPWLSQEFDAFITVDRNLSFQQHLPKYGLAVVLIQSRSNRLADLLPFVPRLIETIPIAGKGVVTVVGL